MNILRRVSDNVLWLYCNDYKTRNNIAYAAEMHGISKSRLIYADKLSHEENIVRMGLADLGLDTKTYNGGATTCDMLWAGLPLLTLKGNYFASRMGASILNAVGLSDLIACTLDEYEDMAVHLASNSDKINAIRERLLHNRLHEPLYDVPKFTRCLEKTFTEMWETYRNGSAPREIKVKSNPDYPLHASAMTTR